MAKKERSCEVGRGLAVSALRPWKGWGQFSEDSWERASAEESFHPKKLIL